jgi:hypothetical protein
MGAELGDAVLQISVRTTIRDRPHYDSDVRSDVVQVAIDGQIGCSFLKKTNVVGGGITRSRSDCAVLSARGSLADGSRTARSESGIAELRQPTRSFFPLNRADLLSWVDMGKTGTGFPGICQILFNDPRFVFARIR